MSANRDEHGFTLIEVLVALVIFGISFGAIAGIFQTALRQSTTASMLLDAQAVAEQQIARMGTEIPLAQGDHTGIVTLANRETLAWRSRIRLAEPVNASVDLALYRIVIDVSAEHTARSLVTLETVRIGKAP